jgi:hypothetical protein
LVQFAPVGQWRVQPPPEQLLVHEAPGAQSMVQPPPEHVKVQLAPAVHWSVQLPLEHVGLHCPEHEQAAPGKGPLTGHESPEDGPVDASSSATGSLPRSQS